MLSFEENSKFVDWPKEKQQRHVTENFTFRTGDGWFNGAGEFCGFSQADVIAALIDLEDAEINSIGDCMTGFCVTPPVLVDFVRKSTD